jgi:hypothetical protein
MRIVQLNLSITIFKLQGISAIPSTPSSEEGNKYEMLPSSNKKGKGGSDGTISRNQHGRD